jgi:rRNA processing protein Krr1/Pno1
VGRILGPRGLTAKQLEQETGCKVMVRGKGSMRDKKKVRRARTEQCYSRALFLLLQFNFVGRILGPRGLTTKQLESETGCKIMVRGKGSMRDKKKVSKRN